MTGYAGRGGYGSVANDPLDHRVAKHIGRPVGGCVFDLGRLEAVVFPDRREIGVGHQGLELVRLGAGAILRVDRGSVRLDGRDLCAEAVETSDGVTAARVHLMLKGSPYPVRVLPAADVHRHKGIFHRTDGGRVVELLDGGDVAELGNPLQQRRQRYPIALNRNGLRRHFDLEGFCVGCRQARLGIEVVFNNVIELRTITRHLLGDAGKRRAAGRKPSHRCADGCFAADIDRLCAQA